MKTSDKGINLIKEFEGCYLTAYKCPAGVWTIGYGHTGKVGGKAIGSGMKITAAKATELLKQDLATFEKAVESCKALTFKPNQNQFDALVSFAFNCGAGSLNTLVKNRDAVTVSEKLLLYNKANGKALEGLTRRRKAERALFDTKIKQATTKSKQSAEKVADSKSQKTLKKGSKVKIKSGATDANTKGKYASFVYKTVYTVIAISGDYVVFGLNGAVTGKTKKSNITLV